MGVAATLGFNPAGSLHSPPSSPASSGPPLNNSDSALPTPMPDLPACQPSKPKPCSRNT
ncbi:uncharacterized protein THITE_2114821 [Thermothielavioides terrestris NRRL 8126]|uniref:Uncharacterized protein n=1 Tax=Thermothielavioides terrestris (strain ATCC 38088 / NRRL 8126) TaxID=578455 RepID=G2R229_THETT|nr:uncharacterized protein THITE_2114821 [Thermothielavioides terrestris NRRL 8126]AEO66613.1 hypothetical protein THITE_2114821 [Thermothielavioides terrestris NRRL 8126]